MRQYAASKRAFSHINLRCACLNRICLRGVNLRGVALSGANWYRAILEEADLTYANLLDGTMPNSTIHA
jgi:uncharacterized protein YjbI with pentapeptide repeats